MKILVIGNATYDVTFPLDKFPVENTKQRVDNKVECGGGPAYNAAYLLGKWGMDTTFAGIIGNDTFGSTNAFIIANTSIGSRTVLTYKPGTMKMKDFDLDFEPDVILIDGQEYDMSVKFIKQYPNAISIIDAGRPKEHIIELSKMVDYVVCSKEFAEEVTKIKIIDSNSQVEAYKKMDNIFKGNIVITLESKGALYKYNNEIKRMPSLKVKAVDSTGAGDIFHGAFTYAIANNYNIEQAVMIGNIAGAYSVTKIGSLESMPSKYNIRKCYNEFK